MVLKNEKLPEINSMETKYYSLGQIDNNRLINILKILFGIACIAISLFWIRFNITSIATTGTLWITVIFLTVFGIYMIWAGMGRATRFIEIGSDIIRLKKNAIIQTAEIKADSVEKIEILPLNIIFFQKSEKRILLRLGTMYHEQNEAILDEIIVFAERNNIPYEIIEEKI